MEAVAAAMEHKDRNVGWICAPTYDLADKIFREIVIVVAEHLRHRIIALRESEKLLRIRQHPIEPSHRIVRHLPLFLLQVDQEQGCVTRIEGQPPG